MVKRHHGTLFRLGESVVIVGLSTFLLLHPVSCYYGFKYYDDMTEKIIACKTIDDLKSSVPQDWLYEVRFEKAGKRYTRIAIHIKPPKGILKPLAFKEPALVFDEKGTTIDHCIREYDAGEFVRRWRESYSW